MLRPYVPHGMKRIGEGEGDDVTLHVYLCKPSPESRVYSLKFSYSLQLSLVFTSGFVRLEGFPPLLRGAKGTREHARK